jgi:hypothetical protein
MITLYTLLLSVRLLSFCNVLEKFIGDLQQHINFNNPHFDAEF